MSAYATDAAPSYLPSPSPTDPQVFSVPRLSGGYDYYRAPPGSSPGINNDYPPPVVKHGNDIGVAAVHIGRLMPPGCTHIGTGEEAIGSVTAMPGAGGKIPGIHSDPSLGALGAWPLDEGQRAAHLERVLMFGFAGALGGALISKPVRSHTGKSMMVGLLFGAAVAHLAKT